MNQFVNGLGTPIDASKCNMVCAGDPTLTCGGPDALSAFMNATAPS